MTDPAEYAGVLAGLPNDMPTLCKIVQGNLLHIFWAERYGVQLSEARRQEVEIRSVAGMLARLLAILDQPFTKPRSPEKRLVGNCRDFSTLFCALLRQQGIPARARCGFATYFEPDKYIDHWVCEYWQPGEQRWVKVDAQLDQLQSEALQLDFSPEDVPDSRFLTGGKAWQMCRAGQADPQCFGILDMWGLWFVRGDLLRDLASLNKTELLPWDCWGLVDKDEKKITDADMALLDRVADLTQQGNEAFPQIQAIYENDPQLCVPEIIRSYTERGMVKVNLAKVTRLEWQPLRPEG
jgi:hypothetical protein